MFAGVCVFRWEINIRKSTVLGIVGAGGIGFALNEAILGARVRSAARYPARLDLGGPNFALDSVFIPGVFGSARKRPSAASTGAHAAAQLTARVTGSTLSNPTFPSVSDSGRRPWRRGVLPSVRGDHP